MNPISRQLGRAKRRLDVVADNAALRLLSYRNAEAAALAELTFRLQSVANLLPALGEQIEQIGVEPAVAASHRAIQFLGARRSRFRRLTTNLYTAMMRALSRYSLDSAIAFGEHYSDLLGDKRAIHSLVKFHKRAENFDRALELLSRLERDDWVREMEAVLSHELSAERISHEYHDRLIAATYQGDGAMEALSAEILASTGDTRAAHQGLYQSAVEEFQVSRRGAALVIEHGESILDSLPKGRESAAIAVQVCEAHYHRGDLTNALRTLEGYSDEEYPKIMRRRERLQGFKNLLDHGFSYELEIDGELRFPAPNSILYVAHHSLPFQSNGYATRTHGLLGGLCETGWDVRGVTRMGFPRDRPEHANSDCEDVATVDSVTYLRILHGPGLGKVPLDQYLRAYSDRLYKLCLRERPAVLHAASNFINGLAANAVARTLGIKSIYEVRGLWEITQMSRQPGFETSEYFRMMRNLEVQAASEADAVVCLTGALATELVSRGVPQNKITVAPNGVDLDRFVPKPRDEALEAELGVGGKRVIGYVGSIVDYEGLDLLLEAVSIVRSRNVQDFAVLIVGEGVAHKSLQERSAELGLDDLVTFTGRVPFEEVARYYSIIDIAPFPRKSLPVTEMVSPLKPFEAMAMGKTVVVSSVAALAEFIEPGINGYIFEKDNVEDLADKLESVLCGDVEESLTPRDWVIEHRTWKSIAATFDHIYRNLTGRPAPVELVRLGEVELCDEVRDILELAAREDSGLDEAHQRRDDYARWSYVGSRIRHQTSLLDVGVEVGQFINAMAAKQTFTELRGVDIKKHPQFLQLSPDFSIDYVSIERLPYADDQFDVVTCLETIEHLPEEIFLPGIAQLRRVCAKQLIITVPFREEVLFHDHHRRFDFADLERLFPDGNITVFRKTTTVRGAPSHWALVEEIYA